MIPIDGSSLTLDVVADILDSRKAQGRLTDAARERVIRCRAEVEAILERDETVYGINTGFGKLASTRIAADRLLELQRNLILSHAVGVGEPLDDEIVRLILVLRANALSRGHSGIRPVVIDLLLACAEADVLPIIPCQGSVGASGDLAPLAHMALLLIGEAEARVDGVTIPAREALAGAGLQPVTLEAKEGLALINGTQVSTAIGAAAIVRARRLASIADIACTMTLEALKGSVRPFDDRVHQIRGHPGHGEVAANVRLIMEGSEILASHADCDRVQDQYSIRCAPQVHGACRDALRHVAEVLETELDAVTDNPLLFPDEHDVISAGNFHAEPVGMVLDYAAIAVSELANISERRLENLVNPDLSGLPPFLARDSGVNSGLMIAQVTAASLVSENKILSHPATVDSVPTSANKEDHVSMAPIAARKLARIVDQSSNVLAIELLAAAEALRQSAGDLTPGVGVAAARDVINAIVAPIDNDRYFKPDIDAVRAAIDDGSLLDAVKAAVPGLT